MPWIRIMCAFFAAVSLCEDYVICNGEGITSTVPMTDVYMHSGLIAVPSTQQTLPTMKTALPSLSLASSAAAEAVTATVKTISNGTEIVFASNTTQLPIIGISTKYPARPTATVKLPELYTSDNKKSTSEENYLYTSHTGSDSLIKGFSIPTFLPPFPIFAAVDLPAYKAAAAKAAAAVAVNTEAAAAVSLSQEQYSLTESDKQEFYQQSSTTKEMPRTLPLLNISVQMGNHAYMPCQIRRLSNKPVSWIRMRDEHIISVDEGTFIADKRFQPIYQESNDYTWSLQIKYVKTTDEGWYECQMATEPKLSAKVYLSIVTPTTEMIGDKNRFVKAGSKVTLHCIVRGTLDPPKYIIWFHGNDKVPDFDELTGWYTQVDRNIFGNVGDNQNTIGSLTIPLVRKEDSGNYTCQPSNSISVSMDLHVLSGEYSASAIMSIASSMQYTNTGLSTFLLLLVLLLVALQKT